MSVTLTGQLALVGRTGALIAISTGLVTAASMPAQALSDTKSTSLESSLNTSASAALTAPLMSMGRSSVLLGSGTLAHGATISALSTARVTFETDAFTAVPARAHEATTKAVALSSHTAPPASASLASPAAAPAASVGGSSVLAIASRYVGIPYVYGGTTPSGFDCSGFTGYVYRQLGITLPRTANEQMLATRRIPRSQAHAGDLVFFVSGGRAYHNGIYAGDGMMYDSPRTGKTLQKRAIWSADVVFTRVTS